MVVQNFEIDGVSIDPPGADAPLVVDPNAVLPLAIASKGRREGASVDAMELMEYVAARVAPHKKIRAMEFIDQLPKSPACKVMRMLLNAPGLYGLLDASVADWTLHENNERPKAPPESARSRVECAY
jgi:hypothetical protein